MKVVGIDAGYKNFSVCCLNSDNILRPTYWVNGPLFEGKYTEERMANEIYAWITREDIQKLLGEADQIVLERQMILKFQALNHCIRFRYFEKTVEVNPNALGKFFNLPIERREKKKAAVDLVSNNLPFPVRTGKKDDYADSYLLAAYVIFLKRKDLFQGWRNECVAGGSRKRKRKSVQTIELPSGGGGHKKSNGNTSVPAALQKSGPKPRITAPTRPAPSNFEINLCWDE